MAERMDNKPEWEHGGALKGAGAGPLPDEAKARIWKAVAQKIAEPAPRRLVLPALVPAAAALVVMLVATAAFYLVYKDRIAPPSPDAVIAAGPAKGAPVFAWTDDSGAPVAMGGEVSAPAGSPKRLVFGPRATAVLDGSTVIEAKAGEVAAEVRSGAVDFEVNKVEGAPPFAVEAQGVRVTVLGTAFRVDVRGREVSVQVHRGHVAVKTASAVHTLSAGESWRSAMGVDAPQAPTTPDLSAKERPAAPRPPEVRVPAKRTEAEQAPKAPKDHVAPRVEDERHEKKEDHKVQIRKDHENAKEQLKDLKEEKKDATPEEKRELREKIKDVKEDRKAPKDDAKGGKDDDDNAVKDGKKKHDRDDAKDINKDRKNRKHKDRVKHRKSKDKKDP